jgi:hypothetical protein
VRLVSPPVVRGGAVLAGALLLAWPAIFNRYPLFYPDSITYLTSGRRVARALFLHQFSGYYGMRSLIYSLGVLPLHWNVTPWPVVVLHAFLAAYLIWLVVRAVLPGRAVAGYLLLLPLLTLLTSISWFASLVMPDILGPLAYLSVYLLVFARGMLSRAEHGAVALIGCWAAASHITHLILAAGLCLMLALLWLARTPALAACRQGICEAALVVIVAGASLLALHAYLYGAPSLNGDAPPFLTARMIADGPGRWYLHEHCPEVRLALCDWEDELPDNAGDFLWSAGGIWPRADAEGDDRIREQESAFVLAVLRAYPHEELRIAAENFHEQMGTFGLLDLDRNNWVLESFDSALPGDKPNYLRSWQANDDLPLELFTAVQRWTVIASLVVLGFFAIFRWGRLPAPLVGLSLTILAAVVANALVAGVLSNVEARYQARVIWLLPLLASLCVLHWLEGWRQECAARPR